MIIHTTSGIIDNGFQAALRQNLLSQAQSAASLTNY